MLSRSSSACCAAEHSTLIDLRKRPLIFGNCGPHFLRSNQWFGVARGPGHLNWRRYSMPSFLSSAVLVAMCFTLASADDMPSKADRLQLIRAEYAKAREDFGKAIGAGTIKPNEDGEYPGWAEVIKRFAKPAHALIDADPADAVALDA